MKINSFVTIKLVVHIKLKKKPSSITLTEIAATVTLGLLLMSGTLNTLAVILICKVIAFIEFFQPNSGGQIVLSTFFISIQIC